MEYLGTLAALGKHEEHFYFFATIEAVRVDGGASAMRIVVDTFANLLVFVGDDEKLHTSSHGIDHLVDTERRDVEHHIAVDDALPILQHEITARDDNHVAYQDDTPQRDVAILVDDGRHDIGTSRRAIRRESQSHTASAEHSPQHGRHEGLVVKQMERSRGLTRQRQRQREHHNGIHRLDAELPPQYAQRNHQQSGIDDEITQLGRDGQRTPFQDGGDTWYATCRDVVGQQEHRPSDAIAQHCYRYHGIVLSFAPQHRLVYLSL